MLENKIAVITGAGRGIGKAIARLYLANGAKVALCDLDKESMLDTVEEFVKEGFNQDNMFVLEVDITNGDEVKNTITEVINKWSRIDILVNNAGITSNVSLLDSTDKQFQTMFDVNVFGVVKMTREVVKYMKEYGGTIINTSSMVGINGGRNQSAYSASKFAVNGLTKSLAKELGNYKIRVNAVAPGVVETDMMKKEVTDDMRKVLVNMTPLRDVAQPNDLAGAYLYLASDQARFTTGTIIQVDGGLVL